MSLKSFLFSLIKNRLQKNFYKSLFSVLIFLSLFVLAGCGSKDPVSPSGSGTQGGGNQTENTISAKMDGNSIQTELATALIFNGSDPKLSMVGLFSNATPPSSISINVVNPGVGTFQIKDGQYSSDDESMYFVVDENEGSGSIKINEISETKVTGTFEFTAIGIDATSGDPNGEQVHITEGSFNLIPISN